MKHRATIVVLGAVTASIALSLGACEASLETSSTSTGGSGGAGASSNTGGSPFVASSSATSSGGSTGIGGGCVGTSIKADPVPLDIFVMLDRSGSMSLDAGNNLSRYQSIKTALATFMQQPSTAGMGMGIQYFGLPQTLVAGCYVMSCATDADCTGGCGACNVVSGVCTAPYNSDVDSCDPLDYAWADVPIQPLPGAGNKILASIGMNPPGTNTPTAPALEGAILYAKTWAQKHADHLVVVALATDGEPSECDIDITNIEASATAGLTDTPSIKTFVVGVGAALQNLDGIAAAGGTTAAYVVDLNAMATDQLVAALNKIRGAALACTYLIPPAPPGMMLDYGLVNVAYVPGGGAAEQTFPKVADKAHCPASGGGWYYDVEAAPTQVILCDGTCDVVSGDIMAEIHVVLGCTTIVE